MILAICWCKSTAQYVVQIAHNPFPVAVLIAVPSTWYIALSVWAVSEVLTLNSPPVTHVAKRRLAGRLAKAISYEATDEPFRVDFCLQRHHVKLRPGCLTPPNLQTYRHLHNIIYTMCKKSRQPNHDYNLVSP